MGFRNCAAGVGGNCCFGMLQWRRTRAINSQQLPPVVVNPDAPSKPVQASSPGHRLSQPTPCGREQSGSPPVSSPAELVVTRRPNARTDQPHRQRDQRGQRRDPRNKQSGLAGRRAANRSRTRYHRDRRTGIDHQCPAARRQYRPDAGHDRRHPDQRSDRRQRRFRFRDVRAERHRTHRGAEGAAKRAVRLGRDGWRRQHHHQEGLRPRAVQCPHRRRKLRHRGHQRLADGSSGPWSYAFTGGGQHSNGFSRFGYRIPALEANSARSNATASIGSAARRASATTPATACGWKPACCRRSRGLPTISPPARFPTRRRAPRGCWSRSGARATVDTFGGVLTHSLHGVRHPYRPLLRRRDLQDQQAAAEHNIDRFRFHRQQRRRRISGQSEARVRSAR